MKTEGKGRQHDEVTSETQLRWRRNVDVQGKKEGEDRDGMEPYRTYSN